VSALLRRVSIRRLQVVLGFALMGLVFAPTAPAAALPPGCSQSGQTVTCTYTSGSNPFVVPAGVSSIHVVAVGGAGGKSAGCTLLGGCTDDAAGGLGAIVAGQLPVTGGSTVYAVVGADGAPTGSVGASGGFNGTGGGASDVRTSQNDPSTRLLVAGGGGGAGAPGLITFGTIQQLGSSGGPGGAAGAAGAPGAMPPSAVGAPADGGSAGGSTAGGAGGNGGTVTNLANCSPACSGHPGAAGAFQAGGAGGDAIGASEVGHVSLLGGRGGDGGDGLFGGGGGGGGTPEAGGGGGGGGSNLVPPSGSASIDTTGVPMVEISYLAVPTSKEQCKDRGWRNFSQFKNQGDCVSFVNNGK
jgi:hypothetical protein